MAKKIQVQSSMRTAFLEGCKKYEPNFAGYDLAPECGDPTVSLRNLEKLTPGRTVTRVELGPAQNILVTWATGDCYLATGFSVGCDDERVKAFAAFLTAIGWAWRGEDDYFVLASHRIGPEVPMEIWRGEFGDPTLKIAEN